MTTDLPLTPAGTLDWKALRDRLAETALWEEYEWADQIESHEVVVSELLCHVGEE